MSNRVDARRRDVAFSVLGGPTTVVDFGGRRILMDPTFDEPGKHDYLTKTVGPAVPATATGEYVPGQDEVKPGGEQATYSGQEAEL